MQLLRYRVETDSFDINFYKNVQGFISSELNMTTIMCLIKMLMQSPAAYVQ